MSQEDIDVEMPPVQSNSGKGLPSFSQMRRSSYQGIVGNAWRSISRTANLRSKSIDGFVNCLSADFHELPGQNNEAIERSVMFGRGLVLAGRGDLEGLQNLLHQHSSLHLLLSVNRHGWCFLHVAAEAGHFHVVRWLIQSGSNGEQRDRRGWTSLMLAASRNQHVVVQLLLVCGFDQSRDEALRVAARNGALAALNALLGSSPSLRRPSQSHMICQGRHCLVRIAACKLHYDCVQSLVMSGYPTTCIQNRMKRKDPLLAEVVNHAKAAHRVLVGGVKGIVVSQCPAVVDSAKAPVSVKIEFAHSGIIVRMRRARTLFRKTPHPIIHRIGYDESVRMLSHDAIALKMLTVKLDGKHEILGHHVASALRHRQVQLSETFLLAEETRALELSNQVRAPMLMKARDSNQKTLTKLLSLVTRSDWLATERILPDVQQLIKQRGEVVAELNCLWKRSVACSRMANQIEMLIKMKQSPQESLQQLPIGKTGARRLEREAIYIEHLVRDADLVCIALGQQSGKTHQIASIELQMDHAVASAIEPASASSPRDIFHDAEMSFSSARSRSSFDATTIKVPPSDSCFKCSTGEATVPLDACRHIGLCRSCGRSERSRRMMRCRTCHSQVDEIMRAE